MTKARKVNVEAGERWGNGMDVTFDGTGASRKGPPIL